MQIDAAMVERLAALARLDVTAEERDRFVEQLPRIVDYVGQLQAVVGETVPTVSQPNDTLRGDEAAPSPARDRVVGAAPETADRFWKVPSVL